jgi:hypothetical protein
MNVFEAILGMRAIREYTAEQVDAKKVRSLIEAAVMAPIAIHREAWAFTLFKMWGCCNVCQMPPNYWLSNSTNRITHMILLALKRLHLIFFTERPIDCYL